MIHVMLWATLSDHRHGLGTSGPHVLQDRLPGAGHLSSLSTARACYRYVPSRRVRARLAIVASDEGTASKQAHAGRRGRLRRRALATRCDSVGRLTAIRRSSAARGKVARSAAAAARWQRPRLPRAAGFRQLGTR